MTAFYYHHSQHLPIRDDFRSETDFDSVESNYDEIISRGDESSRFDTVGDLELIESFNLSGLFS